MSSQNRYYEKNREAILAKMKERNQKYAAERKEFLRQNPDEVETERQLYKDKYYRHQASKAKKQIEAWIKSDKVSAETKDWLRAMLKHKYYLAMKPSVFRDLEQMCVKQMEERISPTNQNAEEAEAECLAATRV